MLLHARLRNVARARLPERMTFDLLSDQYSSLANYKQFIIPSRLQFSEHRKQQDVRQCRRRGGVMTLASNKLWGGM